MEVINQTRQTSLGGNINLADNFFTRLVGLLTTKKLPSGAGLIIKPCSGVHTLGMRYCIDVLFVNKDHEVVKVIAAMKPGRVAVVSGSAYVIELPAGTAAATCTKPGDRLALID
ncbi:hypothetical protein SCACP_02210 [Sporomusa carbonis]|uniref:DUF192 domain-containing protein n=1 Tax=Sporomusa carbonis TaxID=3076075 RepID=UPI003A66E521